VTGKAEREGWCGVEDVKRRENRRGIMEQKGGVRTRQGKRNSGALNKKKGCGGGRRREGRGGDRT